MDAVLENLFSRSDHIYCSCWRVEKQLAPGFECENGRDQDRVT